MDDLILGAEFPAATREQWLALVRNVLKGADFEKKLVSRTYDGIRIEPLYEKANVPPPMPRAVHARWKVAQRVDHPDRKAANDLALQDLEGGADALILVFREAATARGFGLNVDRADDLDQVLRGVMLDLIQVRLEAGADGWRVAETMLAFAERRGHALSGLDLDLGIDPIGVMAASGQASDAWETIARQCGETYSALRARGFRGGAFLTDGRPYHEAGASEGQELAAVLATALAYLRALEVAGHSLGAGRNALSFCLAADADEFLTIAKFRALRRLWTRVEEACGLTPQPIRLHGETAWRMSTRRDPWVNMLRATLAVFSAGLGGADSIGVLPFTTALGLPDTFARRIARNTQLILLEEANLWRVADPVAGAGGFEALTDALCEQAWRLFQELEREGGIVASLTAGALQTRIAVTRAERERAVATRKDPITGTSEFPDIKEAPVAVLLPSPLRRGAGVGVPAPTSDSFAPAPPSPNLPRRKSGVPELRIEKPISGTPGIGRGESRFAPLPSIRLSEPYERLRDTSDARLARTGARPKVFLANLGPPAAFTLRATFVKNFFEAGGIEAITNDGFSTPDEIAAAFAASGAKLACLCSSDQVYAALAAPAVTALRRAGAQHIYIAGRPEQLAEHPGRNGLACLFTGCDALSILTDALEKA